MAKIVLSLLVLRTRKLELLREFYEALGLELFEERHACGPSHYAAVLGGTVLELYPLASRYDNISVEAVTRLGLVVPNLAAVEASLAALAAKGRCYEYESYGNSRAAAMDPDGRIVDLAEEG